MRITIDTIQKTIELKESINFIEFVDKMKEILSEKKLKEYTIKPKDNTIYYQPYIQTIPFVTTNDPYSPPFTVTCTDTVGRIDTNNSNT